KLYEAGDRIEFDGGPLPVRLARQSRLLAGTDLERRDGKECAVSVLLDPFGRVLGWQEKEHAVPAGERIPLLPDLPSGPRGGLWAAIRRVGGPAPTLERGRPRPPLAVPIAGGQTVAVGAMMCFDNAFPGLARRLVAQGARLLVVLSNESWYRGGAERDQLEA